MIASARAAAAGVTAQAFSWKVFLAMRWITAWTNSRCLINEGSVAMDRGCYAWEQVSESDASIKATRLIMRKYSEQQEERVGRGPACPHIASRKTRLRWVFVKSLCGDPDRIRTGDLCLDRAVC